MTYNLILTEVMIRLGLSPSTFSEPERQVILSDMIALENRLMQDTRAGQTDLTLTLEAEVKRYIVPPEVFSIDTVELNGSDITSYRVDPQNITT